MNFEEIALGLNPGKANSRHTSVYDVQEWAWRGLVVGGPVGLSFAGAGLNSSTQPEWQVMEDANLDSLPDGLLAFVTALNADATLVTLPQRAASGDYDGDGMRDFWEHRYNLDLRAAADAQANPDGDSLINSLEYAHDRNPLVSDDPPLEPPDDPNTTPHIVTTSLPDGSVNAGYNVGIVVSGGTSPYVFSVSSGSLPDGLFLDQNGGILGTPTTEMSSSFTVQVVDGSGMSASQAFTLNVQPDAAGGGTGGNGGDGGNQPPPLAITTTDAQMHAVIGRPYSVTLAASGGVSSHYVFTISNMGTLPAGLEYSEETHTLHGTPTATGSCSFTVTLTNASQDGFIVPGSTMGEFTLTVHDVLAFTSESELPSIMKGALFTPQLEVSGGYGQKFFSLTAGALPPGIELTSRGQFLGAPSETGLYAFTVHVTDALGQVKDQEFTLYVSEPPQPLTITTTSLPSGGIGLSYSAGIGVSGGNGDYTFTGGGGIFSVSPSGSISGTPTEAGVYAVSVTVTDTAEGTASATFVISVAAPTMTVISGDKQILKVGDTPEPVRVSLTGGGVGLAGVLVTMGSQSTTTDENGSATFLPQAWMTEGPHDFAVNATGCGATVQMFAFTPPTGVGGTAPDILPGPPDDPPVTPVEDDDVIVESRSVSYTSGTLQANYSSGLAVIYANGRFQPYVAGAANCPDYSSSKTRWTTSDGRSGEGTPPSLESVSWRRGLAGGYDRKYPDTESGPVDGPDLPGGEGGGDIWPDGIPYTIVYGGRYYGKSVGRQKHTTSQVRMLRKTVEEGGSSGGGAISKTFLGLPSKAATGGIETFDSSSMKSINLGDGHSESSPTTTSPAAAVGEAKRENLLPVEIDQQGYSANEGIRFCRWLDSFPNGTFDNQAANKDRDRFRIKIAGNIPNLTKAKIKATDLHGAVVDGQFVNKTTDGDFEVEMKVEGGSMVSTPILLVSDGEDDKSYNGKGTDDGTDDQTLLADFESKIVVTFTELNNAQVEFDTQKAVGEITMNLIYGSVAGDVPNDIREEIYLQAHKMREIYRQIGIKAKFAAVNGEQIPAAWLAPRGPPDNPDGWEKADHLHYGEGQLFMGILKAYQVPAKQIRVGFVNASLESSLGKNALGWGYLGEEPVIVSVNTIGRERLGTTAHEVGHALGLPDLTTSISRLMFGTGQIWKKSHNDSKRFDEADPATIKAKGDFYVPLR